jgi:hypothetical protein
VRYALSSWWTVVGVSAILLVIALTAVPFLVTFDGHFYVSGSRVLFTDQAPDLFWWLRQPGYSIFLRAIESVLGPSDLWFTAAQAICVLVGAGLASAVVWRSANGGARPPAPVVAGCLLLGAGNAGVLLYSSAALQQSLFVLSLGLALTVAYRLESDPSWLVLVAAVLLVAVVAVVQREFAQLMGAVLALGAVLSGSRWWPLHRRWGPRVVVRLITGGVVFVLLQLAVSTVLLPWNDYRDNEVALRSAGAPVLPTELPSMLDNIEAATDSVEPHEHGLVSQVGGFIGLRGSTQFVGEPVEREVYIENRTNKAFYCGAIEGMPPEFDPVYHSSMSGIDPTCRSMAAMEVWAPWVHASVAVYPYVLLLGILAAAGQLLRWRMVLPAGAVLGLTLAYSLFGFGADRYSVPLFPTATSILLVSAVVAARSWVARRRGPGSVADPLTAAP